jgi:hypothetical protein
METPMAQEPDFFVDATGRSAPERRKNPVLRELLDELLSHVRVLSREAPVLPPDTLETTRHRVEWLADEIWDAATHAAEGDPAPRKPPIAD